MAPRPPESSRSRTSAVLTVAAVLLVVAGMAWWLDQDGHGGRLTEPAAAPVTSADPTTPPAAVPGKWRPGAPRRLLIPALSVGAPVTPVRARAGTLVPPADAATLGWWSDGAVPGAASGSALIAGHTVHTGGGALDRLGDLQRGDRIVVSTDRGRLAYVVRRVSVLHKGIVAAHARRLFDQHGPGRLVVVTCGDWDGSRYLSNVVVTARRAA